MLSHVIEYLERKEWVYTNKNNVITFSLSGLNGVFHSVLRVKEEESFISFITYLGVNCPDNKRNEVAQLITHVNSNLLYGNFEMNLYYGNIKFRTGLYYNGVELNDDLIDSVIMKNIFAMDVSSPVFQKFIYGDDSIEDVYNTLYPPTKTIEEPPKTKDLDNSNSNGE